MARIFILLAVVLGVLWWLRQRASARQASGAARRDAAAGREPASPEATQPMVQCAQCGVHLPRTDAIAWQGQHYCRRSHLPDSAGEGGA
ncbi:PP0621 family protein [Cupriavidus sp. CER94]|uniref:PP0621 family protein n=1 Tax=Cupriavidus sp. CER94 TaxID=3377036 RepID=UPI0037F8F954